MKSLFLDDVLKLEDSEIIYNYLVDKVYELLIAINEYKHYPYKEHIKKTNTIKSLGSDFHNNTIMFKDVSILVYNLGYFRIQDLKSQTNLIVDTYNELLIKFNNYVSIYNEILNGDYNTINDDLISKYINLFRDMLSYKNKFYGEKDDIHKLYERVRLCYYDFSYLLDDIDTLVKSCIVVQSKKDPIIKVDTIEYIWILRNSYEIISSEYKNNEAYCENIDLKEGQSIQDLINIIDKKLNFLYEKIIDSEYNSYDKKYKRIIDQNDTLEDKFIFLHDEYSEEIYKIRSIEDDNQLLYYFKKDLYDKIVVNFKVE